MSKGSGADGDYCLIGMLLQLGIFIHCVYFGIKEQPRRRDAVQYQHFVHPRGPKHVFAHGNSMRC